MAFNPNQPRDSHGRFGEVAHAAAQAIAGIVHSSGNAAHVASAISHVLGGTAKRFANFRHITDNHAVEATSLLFSSLKVGNEYRNVLDHEARSMQAYSMTGAGLSLKLRKGWDLGPDKAVVRGLDEIMSKTSLPEDLVLHRGVVGPWGTRLKEGTVITDRGFVSTSINESIARSFAEGYGQGSEPYPRLIHIFARKGSRALALNGYSSHKIEHEVVLPRDSQFRVMKVDRGRVYAELL